MGQEGRWAVAQPHTDRLAWPQHVLSADPQTSVRMPGLSGRVALEDDRIRADGCSRAGRQTRDVAPALSVLHLPVLRCTA